MENTILLIEDDEDTIKLIKSNFDQEGYKLDSSTNGELGLEKALLHDYSLVILDIGLPGLNGLEICKRLRIEREGLPILMLTTRNEEIDRILGLEFGADDYVAKPFSVRELIARVRALLRRSNLQGSTLGEDIDPEALLKFGDLTICHATRKVTYKEKEIYLTTSEFDLLSFLAINVGRPFTRAQLAEHVFGCTGTGNEISINSHMCRIRAKIESDPRHPNFIETIRGVGYRFIQSQK